MKFLVYIISVSIAGCSINNSAPLKKCCENCEEVRFDIPEKEIKPDIFARYPDGIRGLQRFIKQNIVPPTDSVCMGIHGRVVISFVVNAHGDVVNIKVRSSSPVELNMEAIRVVMLLHDWCPAIKSGQPIDVEYLLPISF